LLLLFNLIQITLKKLQRDTGANGLISILPTFPPSKVNGDWILSVIELFLVLSPFHSKASVLNKPFRLNKPFKLLEIKPRLFSLKVSPKACHPNPALLNV